MSRGDYYVRKLSRLIFLPFTPLVRLINWLNVEVDENGHPVVGSLNTKKEEIK